MNGFERLPAMRHGAWVEVDLAALVHNARVIRRVIPPKTRLALTVKANGYGHGLEMAARAAVAAGADELTVATLDEGLALRMAGLDAPILVAYPVPLDGIGDAVNARLEISVSGIDSTRRTLEAWNVPTANVARGVLRVHVEVDTGMGRGGVSPGGLTEVVGLIDAAPATSLVGIWSHLAAGGDGAASREQTRRFEAALAPLAAAGRSIPTRHLAATESIFAATAPAYEMVRAGLGFYGELGLGVEPAEANTAWAADLRPAMAVKARPVRVEVMPAGASVGYASAWTAERRSLIATLPLGYADGWARSSWPGASALVRGRRVPLVGRVSMDSVCADVTDAGEVTMDDELVLLGGQGGERVTPSELARIRGSITHEVFASFGPRLPRTYLWEGDVVAVSHQADRVDRVPGATWEAQASDGGSSNPAGG